MRGRVLVAVLAASFLHAAGVGAQPHPLEQRCDHPAVILGDAQDACLAAAQAILTSQSAIGLLTAGGTPALGAAGTGFRIGLLPRASIGLRGNVVALRLPDLLAPRIGGTAGDLIAKYGAPAPAAMGDLSVMLFPGWELTPGVGGIGGLTLVGNASYLPFAHFTEGFSRSDVSWGVGGRISLLAESFTLPSLSLSVLRRGLGTVRFGDICPSGLIPVAESQQDDSTVGVCTGPGTAGEFAFDLENWSSRLQVGKHLFGIGGSVGLGYDRYKSDVEFGFRSPQSSTSPAGIFAFRGTEEGIESSRWTVFGSLGYSLVATGLVLEGGWQQGRAPLSGFRDIQTAFDPRGGTWFASLGGRVAL